MHMNTNTDRSAPIAAAIAATMYTKVEVKLTSEHINAGVAGDCDSCPAALAILGALPGVREVTMGMWNIWICRTLLNGPAEAIITPSAVAKFIRAFDAGWPVMPFTFEIDVPNWAVKA